MSFCSFCVTSHGWLGATAIAAFPAQPSRREPSRVCRLASHAEEPGVSSSCVQVLVGDGARAKLARLRSYRATLRVTITPSGGAATTASTNVRVRR